MNFSDFCRSCGSRRAFGLLAFVPVLLLLWLACHFFELKWPKELRIGTPDGTLKTGMTKSEVEHLLNTQLFLSKIGHSNYSYGMYISNGERYVLNFKGDKFLDGGRVGEDGHRGRILPPPPPGAVTSADSAPTPLVMPPSETIEFPFDRLRVRVSAAQLLSFDPFPERMPISAFDWSNPFFGSVVGKNCDGSERKTIVVLYPRKDGTSFIYQAVQVAGHQTAYGAGGPGRYKDMRTYEALLSGYRDEWPEECRANQLTGAQPGTPADAASPGPRR